MRRREHLIQRQARNSKRAASGHQRLKPSQTARITASTSKSRKQQQPRIAVGFEDPQAQRGIADLQPPDLPDQMGCECGQPDPGRPSRGTQRQCHADQHHRQAVKYRERQMGARAEQTARSISRRSARRPRRPDGRRWCRSRSPRRSSRHRAAAPLRSIRPSDHRKSHQRAPGEGEAEHDLRPPGDPLHERIDRDDDRARRCRS